MDDTTQQELELFSAEPRNKGGRPRVWTEERIEQWARDLEEWSKQDDAIVYTDFFTDRDYDSMVGRKLCALSTRFRSASKAALQRIGSRREKGMLTKNFEARGVIYSSRMYNPYLNDAKTKEIERDEYARARARRRADIDELKEARKAGDKDLVEIIKARIQNDK
jgi:hypothetical protein